MYKKIIGALLIIVVYIGGTAAMKTYAEEVAVQLRFTIGSPYFTQNGTTWQIEDRVSPFIDPVFNRTMIPLRTVAEAMGADVGWVESNRTAVIAREHTTIVMQVDSPLPHGMGAPTIVQSRVFVPLAYVSSMMGTQVTWDAGARAAYVFVPAAALPMADTGSIAQLERMVFDLTNAERLRHGVAPLIWHEGIASLARAHSQDMGANNRLSHIGSSGLPFEERLFGAGIFHFNGAEHIASGQISPEEVVGGFMDSPEHRRNILDENLTHFGAGVWNSGGTLYWTQKFITVPAPINIADFERAVFDLTNAERQRHGLSALIWHDQLAAAARAHSKDMGARNHMTHTGSNGSTMGDRIATVGISTRAWAENVAQGQRTPDDVMTDWMNSHSHRDNILNENMIYLGVGIDNAKGPVFWTQKFIGE